MKQKTLAVMLLVAALPGVADGLHAASPRALPPHVHGQAVLDIAKDGGALEVSLHAPGMGILDFEHPPADPRQAQAVADALRTLGSPGWLHLTTDPAGGCVLASATAEAPGFEAATALAPAARSAPDQQDEVHEHRHAEFQANYRYACSNGTTLSSIGVDLLATFPSLHRVVVNVATESGQVQRVLESGARQVPLQ